MRLLKKQWLCLAASLFLGGTWLPAASFTWTGSASTDWFNPGNWSPVGPPGSNDTVTVNSGTVNLSAPVLINAQFNWAGGTLAGNALTVAGGALLNLSGGTAKILEITLTNLGTVTWTGSGAITLDNNNTSLSGAIWNLPGGVFNIATDENINCGCYGYEFLNNQGTLEKTAGVGTTYLSVVVTNTGTVAVLEGTLNFNDGGSLGGVYTNLAGTAINFDTGSFSVGTPIVTGPGPVSFTGGTLTLPANAVAGLQLTGGAVLLAPAFQGGVITNLTLAGSTLAATNTVTGTLTCESFTGPLEVAAGGTMNWTGGTAGGSLTVDANAWLNLTGSNAKYLENVLTNLGTVTWTNGGSLNIYNNNSSWQGAIWNLPGGVFNIATDENINCACYGYEFINNQGTLEKTAGSGTTYISVVVTNTGTVAGLAGTLNFNDGGSLGGVYTNLAGTAINFVTGSFSDGNPTITGPGPVDFTGGTLILPTNDIPGLEMTGGTVDLGPAFQGGVITNLTLGGTLAGANTVTGTLTCGGGFTGPLLVAAGGTVNWTGGTAASSVTVAGNALLDWSGGTAAGALTVAGNALLNLSGGSAKYLENVLTNLGTVTWTGGGSLNIYNNNSSWLGAVWNLPGAVFNIATDENINCACYGYEFINNQGVLEKTAGSGTTYIDVVVTNTGTVAVLDGTLNFNNGGNLGGDYTNLTGTAINFDNGNFSVGAPVITGPGPVSFTGGTLTLPTNAVAGLQLTGGTVVLAPAFQGGVITNLTIAGSTLAGTNTVTGTLTCYGFTGPLLVAAGGTANWNGGTANGWLTVEGGAFLNLSGGSSKYLENTLTNLGTVTWTGGGSLNIYNNNGGYQGAIWNLPGGVFNIATDENINCACYGEEFINNQGTLEKTAGTGTTYLSVLFTNTGTVEGLSGTLNFNDGGFIGGVYTAAGGAINFTSGNFSAGVPVITGPVAFTGGNLTLLDNVIPNLSLTSGTLELGPGFEGGTITNLTISGSTLAGTNTVTGTLNWTAGTVAGPLTVAGNALLNISGGSAKYLENVLTNLGTVNWTGGGSLTIYNNNSGYQGAIWNLPGGVFDIDTDENINCACYGYEFFNNQGTLEKTGVSSSTYISVLFTNTGTVEATAGTLNFNDGGFIGGVYTAAGGDINFTGGNFSAGVPAISGPVAFTGGTLVLLDNVISNLSLTAGTVTVGPGFEGGTITNLTISGSTLAGTNTVTGTLNWTAGTVAGPLTVAGNALLNLSGGGNKYLENVLTNLGTVTWAGSGSLNIYNNNAGYQGAIWNLPGGVFNIDTDENINCACYGYEFFNNQGMLEKTGASSSTYISVLFTNTGTVEATAGTLNFNDGGFIGGVYTAAGGDINFTSGNFSAGVPAITGPVAFTGGILTLLDNVISNLSLTAGTVTVGPAFEGGTITNLTISGSTLAGTNTVTGTLTWTAGAIAGPLTIGSSGALLLSGSSTKYLENALTNLGTVTWTGSGNLALYNNDASYLGSIYNQAGGLFQIQNDQNIQCGCYGHEAFNNQGTVEKLTASNTTAIEVPFTNNGTLNLQSGLVSFTASPAAYVEAGETLDFGISGTNNNNGRATLPGNINFDGTLGVNFLNGFTPATSNAFTLFNYGSHGGTFSSLNLPALASGQNWEVDYNSASLVLRVVAAGTNNTLLISGSVTATNGSPIAGATVYAVIATNAVTNSVMEAVTAANGQYQIAVANGSYLVGVSGLPALGFNNVTAQTVIMAGGNQTVNFTASALTGAQLFTITTAVNPPGAGTAGGGGTLGAGATATVTATPVTTTLPYLFADWTENGVFESASNDYSFTVIRSRNLVANFTLPLFTITASNNPVNAGVISGAGSYYYDVTNELTATANFGFIFTNWTEGTNIVGTTPTLTTVVFTNHFFVANYIDANLNHLVTTVTSPSGLAAVAGAGTYTNGQSVVFSAPLLVTNSPYFYTFEEFTLSNTVVSVSNTFSKTFSTLDATNLQYVAVYQTMTILPLLTNVTANYAGPLPATTNFLLTLQFDRGMNTNIAPLVVLTNSAAAVQPVVATNGYWTTTASTHDTYHTPPVTLAPGMDGTLQLWVSGAQDVNGDPLTLTNAATFTVQATPPPAPVLSVTASNSSSVTVAWSGYAASADLAGFRIYIQTTNYTSLSGVPAYTSLGSSARSYAYGGLSLNTNYFLAVQAVDNVGNALTAVTPLAVYLPSTVPPPVGIQVAASGATSAVVSWNGYNTSALLGFTGYQIYYQPASFSTVTGLTPQATVGSGQTSLQVNGLDRTKTTYFAVVGYNNTNGFNPNVTTATWTDPYAGNIGVATTIGGAAPSVVNIYQSITVVNNAVLTVEPGTTLLFAPGTSLTVGQGALVANGTALAPIIFDSANDAPGLTPAAGDWGGVTLAGGAGTSSLQFVEILYGGGLTVSGCDPTVQALTATANTPWGLGLSDGASLNTSAALLTGNGIGAEQLDVASLTLQNSVILNNNTNAWAAGGVAMNAPSNWWGSAAQTEVGALLAGNVTYTPFLTYEPLLTPALGTSNGVLQAGGSSVILQLACRTAVSMRLSEDFTYAGVFFSPFTNYDVFALSAGGGEKHIFAQFRSVTGATNSPIELDINDITAGPVIQSFSLTDGATLNRPVTVTGSATAVLGMQDLEFYLDGVGLATNTGGSFSYYFDIRTLNNAVHQAVLLARDTAGNIATLESDVIISVTPPLPPVITAPAADYTTNNATLTLRGTAEPQENIQVTDNGQVLGVLATGTNGSFSVTNTTLAEGANTLVAVASDSTGTTPSAARHITVETIPPAALVMNQPVYTPGSGLTLSWQYAASGKQASTFELFWSTSAFATTNQAAFHSIPLGLMNDTLQALANGTYYFGVVGFDAAGNPSPLSALVSTVYNATPPVLSIAYGELSPVGVGPLSITLSASEALAATPTLTLQPAGASPVLLSLTNAALNIWQTVFNVTAATPSGTVTVQTAAQDQFGNVFNGAPSGAPLGIDTTPPTGRIVTVPPGPVQTTNDVNVTVSLTLSKPEQAGLTPALNFQAPIGTHAAVSLSGAGSNWNGTLPLTPAMSSGFGKFTLSAEDSVGNIGTNLVSGSELELYNTALPSAPAAPTGLAAVSLPGGYIKLSWNSVSNAQIYRLYRETGTNFTLPGTLDIDNITNVTVTDFPTNDGLYAYAVSASRLGAESGFAGALIALSDRTPPPAPTNVVVTLAASGVDVTWQEPPGEIPDHYNVYRNGTLVGTTGGTGPVVDYPPKGTNIYIVDSSDAIGNLNPSAPVTNILLVAPVGSLAVVAGQGQAVQLSWLSTDPSATGFNLYRNGVLQNASPLTATNYTDNLPLADAVTYAVTAVNSSAQQSPPRLVNVYPVALGLLINPVSHPIYVNYFDQYQAGITNLSSATGLPLTQLVLNRAITGVSPLSATQAVQTIVSAGASVQPSLIVPEASVVGAQTVQVSAFQQTDSEGSSVVYRNSFTFTNAGLPGVEVAVTASQLPLVGGLTTFQAQINNPSSLPIEVITSRGSGAKPGDLYISVQNSFGQEVSRTPFMATPPGTTFLPDGRAYVQINAGSSMSLTVSNVLVPAALAGATNTAFVAVVTNIYSQIGTPNEVVSGPLTGSMISPSLAEPPYYGTAQTDQSVYDNNQPIIISGQALSTATSLPVANVALNIGFATRGYTWFQPVTTDASGNYQYTYNPVPGFGGNLSIWAANPLVVDQLNQAQVVVYRVYASPAAGDIEMSKNGTINVNIALVNPGNVPLTGFAVSCAAYQVAGTNLTPISTLTGASVTPTGFSIAPNQSQTVTLQLAAAINAPSTAQAVFTFTSAEGAVATLTGSVSLLPAVPVVNIVSPAAGYVEVNVNRGGQVSSQITIMNSGLTTLQGITLQPPTNVTWMQLNLPVSTNGLIQLADLPAGQSNTFTVVFTPPATTPLNVYQDALIIHGTNLATPFLINLYALVTSDLTGSAQFAVEDFLGDYLAGATVRLQNNLLQSSAGPFLTDTNGLVTITNLTEGVWNWEVNAPGCSAASGTVTITADQTAYQNPILNRSLVTINFTVVPVPFTDQYEIQVSQTYSTFVPMPVLVMSPPYTGLNNVTPGFQATVDISALNSGLVQITDVKITGQQDNQATLTPLVTYLPVLLPQQTVEIPFSATYSGNNTPSQQGGDGGLGGCLPSGSGVNAAGIYGSFLDNLAVEGAGNGNCPLTGSQITTAAQVAVGFAGTQAAGGAGGTVTVNGSLATAASITACLVDTLIGDAGGGGGGGGGASDGGLAGLGVGQTSSSGGDGCLAPDTTVFMADGSSKPISQIQTNDVVRSGVRANNLATVRSIYIFDADRVEEINLAGTSAKLVATAEHFFWVDGQGWRSGAELRAGDWLLDSDDHRVQISNIKMTASKTKVYTVKLSGADSFYANHVLVHDLCGAPPAGQITKLGVAQ